MGLPIIQYRCISFLEEVGHPVAGPLAVALERAAVDVDEAEAVLVPVPPLEAVHERPREVPLGGGAVDEAAVEPSGRLAAATAGSVHLGPARVSGGLVGGQHRPVRRRRGMAGLWEW